MYIPQNTTLKNNFVIIKQLLYFVIGISKYKSVSCISCLIEYQTDKSSVQKKTHYVIIRVVTNHFLNLFINVNIQLLVHTKHL